MSAASGQTPIHVPRQPKRGDNILPWARAITEAIQRLRDRQVITRRNPVTKERYDNLELRYAVVENGSSTANCFVQPGALEVVGFGSPSASFVPFKYGGGTHRANTAISVANGSSVWAKYDTTNKGGVTAASVELVVAPSVSSKHWEPPYPNNAGVAGNVYVELFSVQVSNNTAKVTHVHQGNPVHYIDAWEGVNLTNANTARSYKKFDSTNVTYEFRGHEGREGYTGDSPDAGTTMQGKVVEDGDQIRYIGTGRTNWVTFQNCNAAVLGRVAFNDGWGTGQTANGTNGNVTITVGECGGGGGSGAHPWKVTGGTSGNCTVSAGFVLGYYANYAATSNYAHHPDAAGSGVNEGAAYRPNDLVLGPGGEYAGGVHAVSGTQYVYAEVNRAANAIEDEYAEAWYNLLLATNTATTTTTVELHDDTPPNSTHTVSVVLSSTDPASYGPTSGKYAVCIAKVTNAAGTVTVDKQYVTHNPEVFLPIPHVFQTSSNYSP